MRAMPDVVSSKEEKVNNDKEGGKQSQPSYAKRHDAAEEERTGGRRSGTRIKTLN